MNTLFDIGPVYPSGFSYFPDFIDPAGETQLLNEISKIELHTFLFQGYEAKRRVASFGFDYSFDKRSLSKGKEIPPGFKWLIEQVASQVNVTGEEFAELLITEYPIGSVINWHRDAPPFDIIAGLSLSADCTFRFRPHDKSEQSRGAIISIPVQRRSLYLIRDEARTAWQHSTMPVRQVRYSITLRTLKRKEAAP